MNERFTVGLIVSNHFGVLNRISGLYGKRGFNIDSLTVGVTEDPNLSRMTIVSTGDEYIRSQVVKQLNKLHDVKIAVLLEEEASISVEHLLIKLKAGEKDNTEIVALLNSYGGKVLDVGSNFITADLTGSTDKIDEFVEKCVPLGILELCRSGSLALSKGTEKVLNIHNFQ
ncbi:MAG: acetolactate synthase small subunit [Papillibacter sp.]|jgi:acetolactate synthase-1/3 small subunit|nr:acetolactate synthase small subunit [Papillibacter sp.]